MKIAAILDGRIHSGGGFNQALNSILQMRDLAKGFFDFMVVTSIPDNIAHLQELDIDAVYLKPSIKDKWLSFCALNPIGRKVQAKWKMIGALEICLVRHQVDLVYFLEPVIRALSLQRLNYVITVWDLCHRDTPEFPEVREFNQFLAREHVYHHCLAQAVAILADSTILADRLAARYGIDHDKIIAMPFSPSPFFHKEDQTRDNNIIAKYKLQEDYFFYPAQFWAHKNHIRILQALLLLKDRGKQYKVVFCGFDHGNENHIRKFTVNNNLVEQVIFLGFVPSEDMQSLYQHCCAVIMPTYFGPTNLPPLEAWAMSKPLIYSSLFREHVQDAALCVNPDSERELADAIEQIATYETCRNKLVAKGAERLNTINEERNRAVNLLKQTLLRFQKRCECWEKRE